MKIFSAIWADGYPFDYLAGAEDVIDTSDSNDLEEGSLLVVWGGEDISPSLYNKPLHSRTGASSYPSKRDAVEWDLCKRAVELGIPIIGVCRGAQMLCALAGGTLIQHVNSHGGTHVVETYDGQVQVTNSLHHQMMNPFSVEHELRAWMKTKRSDVHLDVDEHGDEFDNISLPVEPEYVYFPKVKGFAIQWHPEMMKMGSANQWLLQDIETQLRKDRYVV